MKYKNTVLKDKKYGNNIYMNMKWILKKINILNHLNDLNEQNQTKDPDDLNLYVGI